MATIGLPTCCSCARYLSPTRLDIRLSSRTSSILHQPKHFIQNQHQSRGSSMISKKEPAKTLQAFQDLKNNIKSWAKSSWPTFDAESIVRVVGALNVELPKGFPDYKKLTKSWRGGDGNNNSGVTPYSENDVKKSTVQSDDYAEAIAAQLRLEASQEDQHQSTSSPEKTKSKDNYKFDDFHEFRRNRKELLEKTDTSTIMREQHDLEQALHYYSAISFPDMSSETEEKKSKKQTVPSNSYVSTSNLIRGYSNTVSRYLPQVVLDRVLTRTNEEEKTATKSTGTKPVAASVKKRIISRTAVERVMRGCVIKLRKASSNASRLLRLEEMCKQLMEHPESRSVARKEKVIPLLLNLRVVPDQAIREQANQALVLMGHIDPLPGRGVRILSLDGGGTRALVAIEILKQIEAVSGQPVYKLFDFVCGVSTGSLLGAMMSIWRLPLSEIEHIYKEFSSDMFTRSRFMGALTSVRSHSYYSTEDWEKILQETLGQKSFLDTAKDPSNPKVCFVSSIVNISGLQSFLFRNYNYPLNVESCYIGSMKYKLWEGIRASSAAPLYYKEFLRDEYVHEDGGVLQNNPAAIALHEAKLLWPQESIHCVVSIGNGRFAKGMTDSAATSNSISQKISRIIDSATDTEAVHTVLNDLLPPCSYFRFNPYMSEEFNLDEVRREKWETMQQDARLYLRKNKYKLQLASERLLTPRHKHQQARDWLTAKMERLQNVTM